MGKLEEIRDALANHAKRFGPAASMIANVKTVDEVNFTCVLEDDGLTYEDVRLRPVLDGNEGLTLFPKINTWALAVRIEQGEDWMLVAAGEYDKWRLKIGTAVIEQNSTGLLIKKDADSLKDALVTLIEAVEAIIVLQGRNPDRVKLLAAKTKIINILR